MPLTYYGETAIAYPAIFGAVATPATYYFGLQTSEIYPGASQVVLAGTYIIPTAFDTWSTPGTGTNRIFVASTGGTTDPDAEPNWALCAPGGTIVDGSVIWQDVASTSTPFWQSTTPSFNEVNGNGYDRVAVTNNSSNFGAPSGANPTTGTNTNIIAFPTSTVAWGTIAAVSMHDMVTGGSTIAFMYLSKHLTISGAGFTPSIPALTGVTFSLA